MSATPFRLTVVTKPVNSNYESGRPITLRATCSDVAGEGVEWVDEDGSTGYVVPNGTRGLKVINIKQDAAGTATTALQLEKGTASTTHILDQSMLADATTDAISRG